jgi:hypothetical protein
MDSTSGLETEYDLLSISQIMMILDVGLMDLCTQLLPIKGMT